MVDTDANPNMNRSENTDGECAPPSSVLAQILKERSKCNLLPAAAEQLFDPKVQNRRQQLELVTYYVLYTCKAIIFRVVDLQQILGVTRHCQARKTMWFIHMLSGCAHSLPVVQNDDGTLSLLSPVQVQRLGEHILPSPRLAQIISRHRGNDALDLFRPWGVDPDVAME